MLFSCVVKAMINITIGITISISCVNGFLPCVGLWQVESNQEDLLSHPVVTTLLDYKWKTFSRYFYYMHLLMYSIYLGCLTVFAMTAVPEITGNGRDV